MRVRNFFGGAGFTARPNHLSSLLHF
jgi:hypothetical protein